MQYGITVRDSLAPGALTFSCLAQPANYNAAAWRTSVNGSGTDQAYYSGSVPNPMWLRVKRYANTFACFISTAGSSWIKWQAQVVPMSPNALVGMSVMSANQTLAQVVFDNISLSTASTPPPAPWLVQDMGANNGPGDVTYSNGVFTVFSNSDAFSSLRSDNATFVYQPVSGDLDISAHVTFDTLLYDGNAVAGIMVRQSLAADDLNFSCYVYQGGNGGMETRTVAAAFNSGFSLFSSTIRWVRLVRRGALFDCYSSTDGVNWTLGSSSATELNLSSTVEVGLMLSGGSGEPLSLATFDTVTLNGIASLPGPWQQQDIGTVTAPGDTTSSSGVFTIESNSYDIGGSSDNLHYVYQQAGGDLNIIARATWQQWGNPSGYAKAGVMVRQSLGASDLQFSCLLSAQGYSYAEWRTSSGAADQTTNYYYSSNPYWVKINRTGNNFTCYASSNGSTWTTIQTATVAMTSNSYAGLAQSSYDGNYSLAALDNVTLQANLPTVSITYPVAGSTVYLSQPVVLTATANPSPGATVTSLKYYEGQTLLGSAVSAPYSVNIGVPSKGSHTYTAQVTDSTGLQAVSVAVSATLSNPQITSVSPDHGKAGTQIRVFGVGFGTSSAGVVLSVNGVPAQMTGFGSGEIDGIVPSGFDPGNGSGVGVGFADGAGADGGPAFGPCQPNSICVTSFEVSPTVFIADGNHTATGTVTMSGPPSMSNLSGNKWSSTVWGAEWTWSFSCVSPAIWVYTGMIGDYGCASPNPTFSVSFPAFTLSSTITASARAYYECGLGDCYDPGVSVPVTYVGTGQTGGDTDQGHHVTRRYVENQLTSKPETLTSKPMIIRSLGSAVAFP